MYLPIYCIFCCSDSSTRERTKKFEELRWVREELKQAFIQWIPKRRRTMELLKELASKLQQSHRCVITSTTTGAFMGTVGGVLVVAGLIAAPFTFRAGVIVSFAGAGIGGAGGLVVAGSIAVEALFSQLGLEVVQEALDADRAACLDLQCQLDALKSFISDARKEKVESKGTSAEGNLVQCTALKALPTVNMMTLLKRSFELHEGLTSKVVEVIRKILDELECPDEKEIEMLVDLFIYEKFTYGEKE